MDQLARLGEGLGNRRPFAIVRNVAIVVVALLALAWLWPLRTVPTGHRGVVTVGGAIRGIENEGFLLVWPWQRLEIFNIRAEEATIENAEGSTSDTQPVKVSLTVRYSIATDRVAEVYEKYSHDGNLSSLRADGDAGSVQGRDRQVHRARPDRQALARLVRHQRSAAHEAAPLRRAGHQHRHAQLLVLARIHGGDQSKVTQEQLRLAAENKLLTVQSEQKQKVAVAEAEAYALKAKADGEAYANLKVATAAGRGAEDPERGAGAEPATCSSCAASRSSTIKAERWNGALPTSVYAGAPIPFFNPTVPAPSK